MMLTRLIRKISYKRDPVKYLRKLGAKIGSNVRIYTNDIDLPHACLLNVGNNVIISTAKIMMHDASTKPFLGYSKVAQVIIGDNVFIGASAIILPGVHIGNNVIVGAGSVVTKNIEADSVVVGSPAKKIGTISQFTEKNKALMKAKNVFDSDPEGRSEKEWEKIILALSENQFVFDL